MIKSGFVIEKGNGSLQIEIIKDPIADERSSVHVHLNTPNSSEYLSFNLEEFKNFIDTIWCGI